MTPFLWQVAGFGGFLVLFLALDRALQVRSPRQGAERQTRAVILAAALGGLIAAPAWWQAAPHAFPWALPLLAGRYLAVAGVSFALGFVMILWTGTKPALRLGCWMLLVYLAPLGVAIWGWHLDRFDLGQPVTWIFFALVVILSLGAANGLLRLPFNERGMSGPIDTAIGAVAGLWGVALFAWPAGPVAWLWPWPEDPLTTRLIAAMFLTVAIAGWASEGRVERRIALWVALAYGMGIAATSALVLVQGDAGPILYLLGWGGLALFATWGLITDRAAGSASGTSPRG